ncbi:MAG TPA: Tad domain-containing protein [Bryobacteraceae bacterium]|nr:Tad domain-containing protein [Bryobacteraceae bacterium]
MLIALSLSIFFLLGMVGLAVDVGRMYVVRNESQSFCDSAAMFAANELNGTADGVTAALNKVTWVAQDANGPLKRLEFSTRQFQNVTTTFATAWDATNWVDAVTAAGDPTNYYFVRVQTQNPVGLWFLPVLVGSTSSNVAASAVAGRSAESQMAEGLGPFAPFQLPTAGAVCTAAELADCKLDPNDRFGMVKGEWYTLRWLAGNLDPVKDLPKFCPGDRCPCMLKLANLSGAASAGYAMYGNASDIREAIVGTPPLTTPIGEGSVLDLKNGQVATEMGALNDRGLQDSDPTSNYYEDSYPEYPNQARTPHKYAGNGRRIIVTPIQSAAGAMTADKSNTVVGFAGFFLGPASDIQNSQTYREGHMSTIGACGQYLGAFTMGVPGSGGTGPGGPNVYTLRLYR